MRPRRPPPTTLGRGRAVAGRLRPTSATSPPPTANQTVQPGPLIRTRVAKSRPTRSSTPNPAAEPECEGGQARATHQDEGAGERKGEREEGGEAPRLRDGEHVREQGEELRHEEDGQPEERAAEDELRPAPARGESRERNGEEPRDDDRPSARDRVRSKAERVPDEGEHVPVVLELERAPAGVRQRRGMVGDLRIEPGEIGRNGSETAARARPPRFDERVQGAHDDQADNEEAGDQERDERRVARMDDRERDRGRNQRDDEGRDCAVR